LVLPQTRSALGARVPGGHDDVRALAQGGDPEFAAGCMLYWAEGSKTHNVARLSNSDPEVVRFLVNFLRRHFAVDDECRVSVHGTQVVQTIYGAIQEYGGFGRPEWLD
jgi:hypothetical protein